MKDKRTIIIAALALIFVINIVLAIAGAGKKSGTPEDTPDDQAVHQAQIVERDPAADEQPADKWHGWQKATIASDGVQIYADNQYAQSMDIHPAAGDNVIICSRDGDSCRIRVGSQTGWVKVSNLNVTGEPVVYPDAAVLPEPADIADTETGARLDKVANDYGCVGVQIAVIKDGQISHHYEYGYQDKSNKVPMSADTKIRVASISKVIVGMGVMSMHDMGIVDIDEDVSKYWGAEIKNPNFADTPITFRNIFTHTSSLNDFGYKKRATSVLEENLGKKSSYMKTAPGDIESYDYNNSAMCASGAIAGRAANINYDQYIREYFFGQLGIDASFHASNIKDADKISIVYNDGVPTIRVNELMDFKFYGGVGDDYSFYSGGMIISAKDYAKMVCILLGGGQYDQMYYLSQQSIDQMQTVYHKLEDYDQCLVLRHKDNMIDGRSLYYHNGNMAGVYSLMCYDPASGDGLVIISNGSEEQKLTDGVYTVCGDLAKIAVELWSE